MRGALEKEVEAAGGEGEGVGFPKGGGGVGDERPLFLDFSQGEKIYSCLRKVTDFSFTDLNGVEEGETYG